MQRICKTCKKEIFNSPSNFCSTTCLHKFIERRAKMLREQLDRAERLQPKIAFYDTHKKTWTERPKELSDAQIESIKEGVKSIFNPMENEYN